MGNIKKIAVILFICAGVWFLVIAEEKKSMLSPQNMPGMQGFKDDPIFSPDELSDILQETQEEVGKKSPDKISSPANPIEPVVENPEKVSDEMLERILKGMDIDAYKKLQIDVKKEEKEKKVKKTKPEKIASDTHINQPAPAPVPPLKTEGILNFEKPYKSSDDEIEFVETAPIVQPKPKQTIVEDIPPLKPPLVELPELEAPIIVKPAVKPGPKTPVSTAAAKQQKAVSFMPIPLAPIRAEKELTNFQKGVVLYSKRELRKAIQEFEKALDENEQDGDSYYMLADIYYQLFDIANAWKNVQTAVSLNGGKLNPLYTAIKREVLPEKTSSKNIVMSFMMVMTLFYGITLWYVLKRKSADRLARDEITILKKEIEILKMKNDIQDPRVRYYKALEACENGSTMLSLNNFKSAEEEFMTAMLLYPQVVNAYLGLGYIHFMQKKYETAIRDYAKAIEIDPHSATAYYGIGRALGEKGDTVAQVEKIKMALQIDPNFREALESLQYLRVRNN